MHPLNRKLLRDLWHLRGQVLATALVVASGVAVLVMSLSSIEALQTTADAYYERYGFADVFADVKRAPGRLAGRIADIDGVQSVETRIVKFATLDIEGFAEPVIGKLVSIPERGAARLNRLALRAGRLVAPGRPDEVVLSEPFAEAHGLVPGSRLEALMNDKKRSLRVVGIALSPEYVYAIGPGNLMPDDERFGVLWLGREALEAAYDLDGAFNDVSLSLLRGANSEAVIERLDRLLERYGGIGAYGRADQVSNWFTMNEIEQLKSMAKFLPTIFLAVAAFLLNMVLTRLIATERAEIGLMKAFGYSNLEVGWHYVKLVFAMAGLGILLGWILGAGLGRFNTEIYAEFYRFPFLVFRPTPWAFGIAGLISLAAALVGTIGAVARAVRLPPAEAMRPPAPPRFRRGNLAGRWLVRWLDQPTRIILRQIARWPLRSGLTALGLSLAVAVLVISLQWLDSIDHMVEVFFIEAQRQDVTVGLVEAQSTQVIHDFEHLPGVLAVEPGRAVSATFRAGVHSHRGAIQGVPPVPRLQLIYDAAGRQLAVPPAGLVLSTALADKLRVGTGDRIWVEVLEGRRPRRLVPVVEVFETYIGTPAYMSLGALNKLMLEPPSVGQLHLRTDSLKNAVLFAELKNIPEVSAITVTQAAVDTFYETMGETLMIFVSFFIAFACALAFGVVYNETRIALSERGRELATLRVLGFSRAEISYILLGQIAFLTFIALPLGCLVGYFLAWTMTSSFSTELFRVPFFITHGTFGIAVLIGLAATILSAALVRRRVDHLDLIAVLKTRE